MWGENSWAPGEGSVLGGSQVSMKVTEGQRENVEGHNRHTVNRRRVQKAGRMDVEVKGSGGVQGSVGSRAPAREDACMGPKFEQ